MFAPGKRRVTVYVVFHGSFLGGFWQFACAPAWRHCTMLVSIYHPYPHAFAMRYTMLIEPTAWGLHADVYWLPPEDVAAALGKQGATAIVKQTVNLPPPRIFTFRGLITCVSLIKACLGIKNWRIITPKQLFEYLIRDGAEIVTWQPGEAHDGQDVLEHVRRLRDEADGTGPGRDAGAG